MSPGVVGTSRTMTRMYSGWVFTVRSTASCTSCITGADLVGRTAFGEGDFDERHAQLRITNGSGTGPFARC